MSIDDLFYMVKRADHLLAWDSEKHVLELLASTGVNRVWCKFAITLANMK